MSLVKAARPTLIQSTHVWGFFVWGFPCHSRICHSYEDVTIAVEWLQNMTHTRYSWQLSSEGSLAWHTYCDWGHPFIMAISEDPWHSRLLPSVWQWSSHCLFSRLRSAAPGIRTPKLPFTGKMLQPTAPPPRLKANIDGSSLSLRKWKTTLFFQRL